jgi:hypothetical protein
MNNHHLLNFLLFLSIIYHFLSAENQRFSRIHFAVLSKLPSRVVVIIACNSYAANFLTYLFTKLLSGAFTELRRVALIFFRPLCPSVCLHRITRLSLGGFSRNLIFEDLLKMCQGNSSFIKVWQE